MAVFVRAKKATDPLDDKAKARLRGEDSSSGSDHDEAGAPCLSGLVHAFLESGGAIDPAAEYGDDPHDAADPRSDSAAEIVRELLSPPVNDDRFRILLSDVSGAAEAFSGMRSSSAAVYRRAVMGRLRAYGYNAGICKSRWKTCGGISAGSHEYIDVTAVEEQRYIVDLDFAGEFSIARPTAEYERVTAALPRMVVARAEEVRQAVRIVAGAAKSSLLSNGLHVPPWRKERYMLAKWLGPYRRTVNPLVVYAGASVIGGSAAAEIKCRSVGFDAAPGVPMVPTAAWTR